MPCQWILYTVTWGTYTYSSLRLYSLSVFSSPMSCCFLAKFFNNAKSFLTKSCHKAQAQYVLWHLHMSLHTFTPKVGFKLYCWDPNSKSRIYLKQSQKCTKNLFSLFPLFSVFFLLNPVLHESHTVYLHTTMLSISVVGDWRWCLCVLVFSAGVHCVWHHECHWFLFQLIQRSWQSLTIYNPG